MLDLNVALRLLYRILNNQKLLSLHFSRFYVILIPVESSQPLKTELRIVNLMITTIGQFLYQLREPVTGSCFRVCK